MTDTRRAWTPEAVKELLTRLADIGAELRGVALSNNRAIDLFERALAPSEPLKIEDEGEPPEAGE